MQNRPGSDWLEVLRTAVAETVARLRPLSARLRRGADRWRRDLWHAVHRLRARLPRWRPVWPGVVVATLAVLALPVLLYTNCGAVGCPDVTQLTVYQPGGAAVLLDRDGEWFADLAPFERVVVSLDSLPEHVANAFIAIEDRRFWRHDGVDWVRVFGAALANLRSRSVEQGSSTIPMQLARNVFPAEIPGTERTLRRKLREIRVARIIEQRFDKREILELYLNHIYFGGGAYGVEAAARLYFGKSAATLTLAESALLAALPKAPSSYDPRRFPERSRERRDLVLALLERQSLADATALAAAREAELGVRTDDERDRSGIPLGVYFIDVVRTQLEDRIGEALYRSRLRIYTTLDAIAQRATEQELSAQLDALDGRVRRGPEALEGAVVLMAVHTGDIHALVGGRDPLTSRYNRATRGQRQVGSAFKPFVFAAALADGVPTSQVLLDAPLRMELSRHDVWQPVNYDRRFEGPVSLRQALVRSRNVPTVRLANAIGIADVARAARAAGVQDTMDETPALALGTVATNPLALATAFATFATLGERVEPRFVLRVEHEDGRVLWEAPPVSRTRGIDAGVAFIITDILRDAVDYGTGTAVRRAGFRGPVAGKTGTTSRATDTWFVGYTPELVGAVWIGFDTPTPLGANATGGSFAAPVWGRIMQRIYENRPQPAEWEPPAGVQYRRIDPYSGLVLADGCYPRYGVAASEVFWAGNLPSSICPHHDWWSEYWTRLPGQAQQQRPQAQQQRPQTRRQQAQRPPQPQRRGWFNPRRPRGQ